MKAEIQERHDGSGPVVHGKQFYYLNYEGKTQEHFQQISNVI